MPSLLDGLTAVGTAAMLWVGGGIIVHGLEHFQLTPIPALVRSLQAWAGSAPVLGAAASWTAFAAASAATGLIVGGVVAGAMHLFPKKSSPSGGGGA
jgi:predicted DNA repair protein MutK